MGLVNGVYNWGSVKALYFVVISMNLAGMVAVVLAILWAIRFERGFGDYLNLVSPGDGHVWTTVIISAMIFCSPAYILGVKSWLYLKLEPSRSDLEGQPSMDTTINPQDVNRLLFFHVVACLLSGFLVALLNATYLLLLSGFHQKSRDGLIEAIEKYGSDVVIKARVDAVQSELECCGDNSYEDWFRVPWLKLAVEGPEDVDKGPRLEEQSVSEDREEESTSPVDVPFSCCSNDIPKPCVHHDILNPSAAYDYNPKHLTIATLGCRSKIINRGEVIRTFLAGYLALLSVYQMVLSFMSRLLQTAHGNEFYIGPQKTRYYVWILYKPEGLSQTRDSLVVHKRRQRSQKGRSSQRLPTSSSSSESLETEESEISVKRGKKRTNSMKLFRKIRSKMSYVRSKSFPLIQRSNFFSKKRRKQKYQSEDEDEEENQEESSLLDENLTQSEVILKRDSHHSVSLPANPSSIDLPPPPPPPPPFIALNLEEDDKVAPVIPPASSKMNADTNDPLDRSIIKNQNSGRRVKVLEKFGQIWELGHKDTQHRETGGADSQQSLRSDCSRNRSKLSSTDIYDRFRGTLQHTLARREAIQRRRYSVDGDSSTYRTRVQSNLDIKRNNLLARLRCNDVPPSYRLLANIEVQNRPVFPTSSPPPPPPPLYMCTKPDSFDTKSLNRRQCSICNRPVKQTSDSSSESLIDHDSVQSEEVLSRVQEEEDDEHCTAWNQCTSLSKSFQQR